MKHLSVSKSYVWLTIFSIAMALLETAVVIYLRKIYYPEGFNFPLRLIDKDVIIVELFRELATIVMLFIVGILTGRTKTEKFGMFLYAFAIWDIFYYVFLKAFINWPDSLMTWDILFLIPTTWTGPVLSPIFVTLVMILFAALISFYTSKNSKTVISLREWIFLGVGSLILIAAFTYDYSIYILKSYSFTDIFSFSDQSSLFEYATKYIPVKFPWGIFTFGLLTILVGIGLFTNRNIRITTK